MRQLDLVIIGRGLFGAAAGRHLAQAGHDVTIIGPAEPAEWSRHEGVFASHYDEGRITRVLDRRLVWAELAAAAIGRYRDIEAASGVHFYREAGFLALAPEGTDYVDALLRTGAALGVDCARLDEVALARQFPLLATQGMIGAWEPTGAGVISPRALVAAQTGAAVRSGASLGQDWARSVSVHGDGVHIELGSETVCARAVLVTTGAFTDAALLDGMEPPIDVQGRTVIAADVTQHAEVDALSALPAMIGTSSDDRTASGDLGDWYALPALRYPDGRRYLKIGTGRFAHPLRTLADKQAWYRGEPDPRDAAALREQLGAVVPTTKGLPGIAFNCAYTGTGSGYPIIDWVVPGRLALCTGGNGAGAKSSDEIGRLGASLLSGDDVPEVFALPD